MSEDREFLALMAAVLAPYMGALERCHLAPLRRVTDGR
jgi:hypothetical protein